MSLNPKRMELIEITIKRNGVESKAYEIIRNNEKK